MTGDGYGRQWQLLREQAYRVYGYICYGCSQPIDPTLPKTHRLSRTVDHTYGVNHNGRVPRIEDVRPYHRACNTRKENNRRRRTPTPTQWHSQPW